MQLRKLGRIPTASRRGIQCFLTGVGNIHLEVPTLTPLEGDWDDRVDGDGDEMDLAARVADIAQKDSGRCPYCKVLHHDLSKNLLEAFASQWMFCQA